MTIIGLGILALGATVAVQAAAPVITSFSGNGVLVCSNLAPGSVAAVEWASSLSGPWQTNWAGLEAVTAGSNGMIQVSVPMFYRVRGTTNSPPSGMVLIPSGSFTMGNCMVPDEGWPNELPLHTVYVSAFYMDRYEVSKALWDEVYAWATNRPADVRYSFEYGAQGKSNSHPAQAMTWYDAVKWCNARSEKEGRVPCYYTNASLSQPAIYRSGQFDLATNWVNWAVSGYRLPTEAEWEMAARGGVSAHRFPWSDSDTIDWSRANYYAYPSGYSYDANPTEGYHPTFATNDIPHTSPVGYFAANGYGLYDMAGNVWEWCWDWFDSYSSDSQTDPRGPATGSERVGRGGGWNGGAIGCRSASRGNGDPGSRGDPLGFRCVSPVAQ